MELCRTIHTVGQGAFYSEQFKSESGKKFTVVYDCGSITNGIGSKSLDAEKNKGLRRKIKSDLGDQKVDILFISHFDTDHINGCQFLDPKVVIIPFISEEEINILSVISMITDGETQIDILRSPENYFRNSRIIRVGPAEEAIPDNLEPLIYSLPEEGEVRVGIPSSDQMASGQPIHIDSLDHPSQKAIWEYVPYNPHWQRYYDEFIREIKAHKDLEYKKINAVENGAYVKSHIKELREIYNNLGQKNKHSLVVYSGPLFQVDKYSVYFPNNGMYSRYQRELRYDYWRYHHRCEIYGACIYYGDITIEDKWFRLYQHFIESSYRANRISTVQIPHHGALSSKGPMTIDHRIVFSVISVGDNNDYGHPSAEIIGEIISKRSLPVLVTEESSSVFIQQFYIF